MKVSDLDVKGQVYMGEVRWPLIELVGFIGGLKLRFIFYDITTILELLKVEIRLQ
jgi:hypothetical protein